MPKTKSIPPLHRHLHLQHRRHTGRRLQHRHTSYRGLAIFVVLAGIAMLSLGAVARATADSFVVTARNPAPLPTEPAIITSPTDNAVIVAPDVTVHGTCQPDPDGRPRVVVILLDGTQAASTPCNNDGTFSAPITVALGAHALSARIYTVTGDAGPDGPAITIYYVVRSVGGTEAGPIGSEPALGLPLVLTIDEPFIVFGPAKDAVWLGTITGGILPYKVHITWGDGTSGDYTITVSGQQHFTHRYHTMQPHIIVLRVNDAAGRAARQTYAAVTPYVPPTSLFAGGATTSPWSGTNLLGIYGAYLLVIAFLGFVWARRHPFAYAKAPVNRRPAAAGRRRTRRSV